MTILDRPPSGWQRQSIPQRSQIVALKRALLSAYNDLSGSGLPLGTSIEIDHRPPLYARKFDTDTNDTVPSAGDPAYLEVITSDVHAVRTHGTKATSYGSDAHQRAKERRLSGATPKRQSRPMPGTKASGWKKKISGKVERR
jgi:hypothetical protein